MAMKMMSPMMQRRVTWLRGKHVSVELTASIFWVVPEKGVSVELLVPTHQITRRHIP
jgi:hypothetical protein